MQIKKRSNKVRTDKISGIILKYGGDYKHIYKLKESNFMFYNELTYPQWLESFKYATVSGAKLKDVHGLFRENEAFRKDFMDIEATGFHPEDVDGRLEFSAFKPSGSYMRHGESFMGMGAIPEWMGEHKGTTAGIGVGALGLGYLGRKRIPNFMKGGGMKSSAAAFAPMLLRGAGAPEGAVDIARLASGGYLGKKALTSVPRDFKAIKAGLSTNVRAGMMKDIKSMKSAELKTLANALDVKTTKTLAGGKGKANLPKQTIQKNVTNKVKNQSIKKTATTIGKKKGSQYFAKKAALWTTKAAIRQAGGSSIPLAGNIVMGLWSAYDLADLGGEWMGWWD